jgi:hypothetical protein
MHWITGSEFGEQRRKLILEGHHDESPEFQRLWAQIEARDDYLWNRYAGPYLTSNPGQWAAISLDGEVIVRQTSSEVMKEATERFGGGNFSFGKLAEFRGFDLSRC